MRKIVKNTIITLLNPISPIVTLFIGWLLSLLVTKADADFPAIVNYMINNPIGNMIFLVLWLIFSVVYTEQSNRIQKLIEEAIEKDEKIKEKDNQLNHTAGIILNRSGDFARFSKFLRFNDVLQGFVKNNILVESAQIYSYSIKRVKSKVNIKVEFDSGYVSENVDINNLAQTYYEIDYSEYTKLKDIIKIWKELSTNEITNLREKDVLISTVVNGIMELFKKYFAELVDITDVSLINNEHFIQYRILTLLIRLARRYSTTTIDNKNILGEANKEIEYYLLNGQRTGILSSILLEDTFMFKYTRNSHKKKWTSICMFPC